MKKNNILSQKEGIFYEGIVTLQQFNKNKKLKKSVTIKNSGELGLLKFLGYAFSTDFSNISLYCPYAIKGGQDSQSKESFIDPIPIRSTPTFEIVSEDNIVTITFIFDIPYYLLKDNVSYLYLINKLPGNDAQSLCASVDLGNNIIRKDTTLTNVIYWTLTFYIN